MHGLKARSFMRSSATTTTPSSSSSVTDYHHCRFDIYYTTYSPPFYILYDVVIGTDVLQPYVRLLLVRWILGPVCRFLYHGEFWFNWLDGTVGSLLVYIWTRLDGTALPFVVFFASLHLLPLPPLYIPISTLPLPTARAFQNLP